MRTMITNVFVSVLLVGFTGTVVGWGSPAPFSAEPKCAGEPEGTEYWMALANHPECYVWNPNLQPDETVTWTAECSGGLAQGTGTLTWVLGSGKRANKGLLQDGKMHGHWVESSANGTVREGSYVDGKRHGHQAAFVKSFCESSTTFLPRCRSGQVTARDRSCGCPAGRDGLLNDGESIRASVDLGLEG